MKNMPLCQDKLVLCGRQQQDPSYVDKTKFVREMKNVLTMTLDWTRKRFFTDRLGLSGAIIYKTDFTRC